MTYVKFTGLFLALFCILQSAHTQTTAAPPTTLLIGRWEVLSYSEQGVQVDKKQPAMPQAVAVYRHIGEERARNFYGYSAYDDDLSRRRTRAFEHWAEHDSTIEVARIAQAIATPYFAVFFADSTLALYNKDAVTSAISFPEARHYVFTASTMSIDLLPGQPDFLKHEVQILLLTETRLKLFLPETAEVVELVKTVFTLP